MKIAIIKAVFFNDSTNYGDYHKQPSFNNVDRILVTNNKDYAKEAEKDGVKTVLEESGSWESIDARNPHRLQSKIPKILPHRNFSDYDYWLWVDTNFIAMEDPNVMVDKYLDGYDICVQPHPQRQNYVEEAQVCAQTKRDDPTIIQRAVDKYIKEGCMPIGLYECNCILRRNCPEVIKFNETWWNEVSTLSIRDQISFPYSLLKSKLLTNHFPGNNTVDERFPWIPYWGEIIRTESL